MSRLLALAVLLAASPAAADLRFALRNDVFTDLSPPIDDAGFTQDFDIRFWRPYRGYAIGGMLFDRWVTSRVNDDRRDLLELAATVERPWLHPTQPALVTVGARLGPVFTGNLGGRWMQNGWHTISKTGPTLDEGLQHNYVGELDAGAFAGVHARGEVGTWLQGYGSLDGQVSVGTGVSWIEAAIGARGNARVGRALLSAHVELAESRFAVTDDLLALPGGYGEGMQFSWRAGVAVAWQRLRFEYQYRTNEGGSGEPIGVIAFTIKQAGTTF
ncbi:MAG: hypothetical protein SFX73_32130 [Kofleriaceae bacterium]|nr:hypothetical protein [Kofleriaceae bacterium]